MANVTTVQTLIDGQRNLVMLLTGVLDTSNEAKTVKVDVSALGIPADEVVVDEIEYSISGSLKVLLNWDATTDVTFAALSGQGEICAKDCGGIKNNAGAGKTGDIELSTQGWTAGVETYTILLWMRRN